MPIDRFQTSDGTTLAVHILGEGRPVVLLHGFLSSARRNWFAPGLAQALVQAGHQVIAPDLRGHGQSDAPTDPEFWPADILASDQLDLVAHLGLTDYDLAGYSLGGRTAVRAMIRGLRPRRVVLGGMGDTGVMEAGPRAEMFEDAVRHGEAAKDPRMGRAIHEIMADGGLDARSILGVLASFQPTTPQEISALDAPLLAILGADDHDNGSAERLAALLPNGRALSVPGDHGRAVSTPELRAALVEFLA
jgi:pimeloyl-ACP methyl ester carboxylesterase